MDLLIDSGAFSAWTKKLVVDREAYANFCLERLDLIDYVVNLDKIPGEYGDKDLTPEKIEDSASTGWDNCMFMLSKGIPKEKLVHVFHQGESFSWLERMRDYGLPYIGLSPANDRGTTEKMRWLDECMYYVTDSRGLPMNKWHGFAVTSIPLLRRFPWFSCDSATFIMFAVYGVILVPAMIRGKYIFDEVQYPIHVSIHKPLKPTQSMLGVADDPVRGLDQLPSHERKVVDKYIAAVGIPMGSSKFFHVDADYKPDPEKRERWCGKAVNGRRCVEVVVEEGLVNSHLMRTTFNAIFMAQVENAMPIWPWSYKSRRSLGVMRVGAARPGPSTLVGNQTPVKLFYAGAREIGHIRNAVNSFTGRDQYRHLVSYFYKDNAEEALSFKQQLVQQEYV